MIAGCPKCSARYRVDAERIGPQGAKLRCTKCSAVFLVRAPSAAPVSKLPVAAAPVARPGTPSAARTEGPATTPCAAGPAAASGAPSESPPAYDRERLVLVADPDEARGKASAEAIESWGLQVHRVHDGVEAMLGIQRLLPSAVVLDAALPRMFGFQVCEVVKRNESLKQTLVVLVGAIHEQSRYRRDPSDLYGADVYIEQPDLPEGLEAILRGRGMPMGGAEDTPADSTPAPAAGIPRAVPPPEPRAAARPVPPVPSPSADAPVSTDEDPEKTEERERARRLARIAVSEMLLYQPEKFERAIRDGNLEQVLDLEIQEAQALLRQRIGEEVRAETDFVMDELARVAAERSGGA